MTEERVEEEEEVKVRFRGEDGAGSMRKEVLLYHNIPAPSCA